MYWCALASQRFTQPSANTVYEQSTCCLTSLFIIGTDCMQCRLIAISESSPHHMNGGQSPKPMLLQQQSCRLGRCGGLYCCCRALDHTTAHGGGIRVALVLWSESKALDTARCSVISTVVSVVSLRGIYCMGMRSHLWQWTQKHSGNLNPVVAVRTAQQCLQITTTPLQQTKNFKTNSSSIITQRR